MRRHRGVLLALLVAVAVAGVAAAGSGAPNPAITITDFEDGDTAVDKPGWSGFTDPNNVFGTIIANPLNDTRSGLYQGDLATAWQPVNATRDTATTQNASFTIAVAGEDGAQARHNISFYNTTSSGAEEILSIDWAENVSDFDPAYLNVTGASTTQIGTWQERSTQIQTVTVDFNFSSSDATVYLNGTAQATVTLAAFSTTAQTGWDRMTINSEIGSQPTAADSQIRIDDIGAEFTNHAPAIDNGTGTPTGDVGQPSQTLSVDVTDAEFGAEPNEELTVEWYQEGSQIDTTTVTSNGTVSTTTVFDTGGEANWSIIARDSHGGVTESQNFTVNVPAQLEIRKETAPGELVDDANATVIFQFDNQPVLVEQRNTTNGIVNMTNLPANRPFVVEVSAPNYTDRRVYISSLFDKQQVYMLNTTAAGNDAVDPTFVLRDFTGRFGGTDTVLSVQRPINQSWQTVEADFFGSDNRMSATLRADSRHRLVVENVQSGDRRVFNGYFPSSDRDHIITITADSASVDATPASVSFRPQATSLGAGNVTLSARFDSGADAAFDAYNITIWANGSARTQLATRAGTDADGERLGAEVNLTDRGGETIEVRAVFELDSGETVTRWQNYTVRPSYTDEGILDILAGIPARIGGGTGPLAMLAVLLSSGIAVGAAARYQLSTELIGLVVVGGVAIFAMLGWLPMQIAIAGGIVWSVAAGLRRGL